MLPKTFESNMKWGCPLDSGPKLDIGQPKQQYINKLKLRDDIRQLRKSQIKLNTLLGFLSGQGVNP